MGAWDQPQEILVAGQFELLASFLEDVCQVGARGDFDGGPPQVRGDDHDVRRHGGGCLSGGGKVYGLRVEEMERQVSQMV